MGLISPGPKEAITRNAFVHVSTQTPAFTVYRLKSASTIVSGSHGMKSEELTFSNPLDQKAWEAYKKIEPRYSNANLRLAQ